MKNSFNVTLNKQIIYSYQVKNIPARLRRYLDEIDRRMQQGILLGDVLVKQPTNMQKLKYIALSLFYAIENKKQNDVEVMSAYISINDFSVNEIQITEIDDILNLNLI